VPLEAQAPTFHPTIYTTLNSKISTISQTVVNATDTHLLVTNIGEDILKRRNVGLTWTTAT
jgi:hypothetical protein